MNDDTRGSRENTYDAAAVAFIGEPVRDGYECTDS
jgi:hypothetical protein